MFSGNAEQHPQVRGLREDCRAFLALSFHLAFVPAAEISRFLAEIFLNLGFTVL
jgi:hypothetical protein